MKTVRLYDENAYLDEFTATVVSVIKAENGFGVVLDKTAFFPESGGQPSDRGFIDSIEVFDVKIEDDEIVHYVKSEVKLNKTVKCSINFERRFWFMQNHTGEHIVSGFAFKFFGLNNVGFHLDEGFLTADFDGELNREQLKKIEYAANKSVWENRKIRAYYPEKSELENLTYRFKREVQGDLRIVEIEGVDACACCAPHVKSTGEIGIIKLLSTERMRGGTRVIIKCGKYALDDYNNKFQNIAKISEMLSSKQENSAEAVNLLGEKLNVQKQNNADLKRRFIETIIKNSDKEDTFFYEENFDIKELQLLADGLHKTYGGLKAVFSNGADGYNFAICDDADKLEQFFTCFKEKFSPRGGGRNTMVQGSLTAEYEELKNYFSGDKDGVH